mmetsp:Transcript_31728/g.76802  ORF Transcript_31728/g.76802 Transcript_31728/m.76802 type:complete len:266 (-) Transcript_31728:341-1138(-)
MVVLLHTASWCHALRLHSIEKDLEIALGRERPIFVPSEPDGDDQIADRSFLESRQFTTTKKTILGVIGLANTSCVEGTFTVRSSFFRCNVQRFVDIWLQVCNLGGVGRCDWKLQVGSNASVVELLTVVVDKFTFCVISTTLSMVNTDSFLCHPMVFLGPFLVKSTHLFSVFLAEMTGVVSSRSSVSILVAHSVPIFINNPTVDVTTQQFKITQIITVLVIKMEGGGVSHVARSKVEAKASSEGGQCKRWQLHLSILLSIVKDIRL